MNFHYEGGIIIIVVPILLIRRLPVGATQQYESECDKTGNCGWSNSLTERHSRYESHEM